MSVSKSVSGHGTVAPSVGAAMVLTFTPKSSFMLRGMMATGDTGATLTSGMSGEGPVFVDPVECALLSPSTYHALRFDGVRVQAGVPVTFTYTAGSTTEALRLTLVGDEDC